MSTHNDDTLQLYIEESLEHLADIENDFLAIEKDGKNIDEERVNKVFRAAHSIKGGAGFMGLENIKELAHKLENVLGMIRNRELIPNAENINILLLASDALKDLLQGVEAGNHVDISRHIEALEAVEQGTALKMREDKQGALPAVVDISFPDEDVSFQEKRDTLSKLQSEGKFIYLARIGESQEETNRIGDFRETLAKIRSSGIILNSTIEKNLIGKNEPGPNRSAWLLFSCVLEPEDIHFLLETEKKNIFLLNANMAIEPIAPVKTTFSRPSDPTIRKEQDKPEHQIQKTDPEKTASLQEPCPEPDNNLPPNEKARADASLRVKVPLLDSLINLAGELVLSRNQLLQLLSTKDMRAAEIVGQRISLITSELQETVMATRMQPIGNIFNKFPRVVRDLARNLKKEVELTIEGGDVELDKTIIEAISDPLTHLIRNSVDHGIENPEERENAGKSQKGKIGLRAYHEAGQVNIEITDDGMGLDGETLAAAALSRGLVTTDQIRMMADREKANLIFLPGFSMSPEITDISGRGVGMDVVKTNLDRLGGQIDIDSQPGKWTKLRIRLPLTLAVIPSQIIVAGNERFAIPQVNLEELLRIPANQVKDRIEKVGDAEVVRLRKKLLPLVRLSDIIGMANTYFHPVQKRLVIDRRKNIADRRSRKTSFFSHKPSPMNSGKTKEDPHLLQNHDLLSPSGRQAKEKTQSRTKETDRRYRASSALNIVVVSAGIMKYGMLVDRLLDSEEIVIKPLGRHLKSCKEYAGATIMGDGRVILILDVANVAHMAGLTSMEGSYRSVELAHKSGKVSATKDTLPLLLFRGDETERFGLPLSQVIRIEKIRTANLEEVGGNRFIQYRGKNLPLLAINEAARVKPVPLKEELLAIVFRFHEREIGLLADGPVDAVDVPAEEYDTTLKQPGIMGSLIIKEHTTMLVDIHGLIQSLNPEWFSEKGTADTLQGTTGTILLVEDSTFFRNQVKGFIEDAKYDVIEAEDGLAAWDLLEDSGKEISLVVTDIEMPNLNGIDLTRRIRNDKRFSNLPIVALTTLASDREVAKGKSAGVDDYLIKLDREKMLKSIDHLMNHGRDMGNTEQE